MQSYTQIHCTKVELLYSATASSDWPADGFVATAQADRCSALLQALADLDETAGAAQHAAGSVRRALPVECVEFALQQFGSKLQAASGTSAAAPGSKVITQEMPRDAVRCLRSVALLTVLLKKEVSVHALKIMAALAGALVPDFAGTVRCQAWKAWHVLVQQLAAHAPDMLAQAAAQIVGHVLAALSPKAAQSMGAHASASIAQQSQDGSDADDQAAIALLRELIVVNHTKLGAKVLAALPPLPDDMYTARLAEVKQVCYHSPATHVPVDLRCCRGSE